MKTRTFPLSLLAALSLSACAVGPDYALPPPPKASSGPFLANGAPPVIADTLPQDWWRMYDDAVLNGLVADAVTANTDLRQAVARIERARAGLRGAGADRLPQASIGVGGNYARQPRGLEL